MSKHQRFLTADQRAQAGGPAKRRINITERRDLQTFSAELGCTREELKAAVEQVGNIVSDVANHLQGKTQRSTQAKKKQAAAALDSLFEQKAERT